MVLEENVWLCDGVTVCKGVRVGRNSVVGAGAVVGIGGWLVLDGRVSVGTIGAFILLLSYLFEPVQQLSQLFDVLQRAGAALNKLFGLLDTPPELTERPGAVVSDEVKVTINIEAAKR